MSRQEILRRPHKFETKLKICLKIRNRFEMVLIVNVRGEICIESWTCYVRFTGSWTLQQECRRALINHIKILLGFQFLGQNLSAYSNFKLNFASVFSMPKCNFPENSKKIVLLIFAQAETFQSDRVQIGRGKNISLPCTVRLKVIWKIWVYTPLSFVHIGQVRVRYDIFFISQIPM